MNPLYKDQDVKLNQEALFQLLNKIDLNDIEIISDDSELATRGLVDALTLTLRGHGFLEPYGLKPTTNLVILLDGLQRKLSAWAKAEAKTLLPVKIVEREDSIENEMLVHKAASTESEKMSEGVTPIESENTSFIWAYWNALQENVEQIAFAVALILDIDTENTDTFELPLTNEDSFIDEGTTISRGPTQVFEKETLEDEVDKALEKKRLERYQAILKTVTRYVDNIDHEIQKNPAMIDADPIKLCYKKLVGAQDQYADKVNAGKPALEDIIELKNTLHEALSDDKLSDTPFWVQLRHALRALAIYVAFPPQKLIQFGRTRGVSATVYKEGVSTLFSKKKQQTTLETIRQYEDTIDVLMNEIQELECVTHPDLT